MPLIISPIFETQPIKHENLIGRTTLNKCPGVLVRFGWDCRIVFVN